MHSILTDMAPENSNRLPGSLKKRLLHHPGYSVRRFYVDSFHFEQVDRFPSESKILDLGGKRRNKRGVFDIEAFSFQVDYANIDRQTEPDYVCDAFYIPVKTGSYDAVILSELLEHVRDPITVLKQALRVLKVGGKAVVTAPFMFHIHGDPKDYGRYTDQYWLWAAREAGFSVGEIRSQGGFYALIANLLKVWQWGYTGGVIGWWCRRSLLFFYPPLIALLMWLDAKTSGEIFRGHTLGFEMVFVKDEDRR